MPNTIDSGVKMSLTGKVALITGGSRGIGAATVRMFRQAGAKVAFSYRVSAQQAEALAAECGGPDHCRPIRQPLSPPEDGQALVAPAVAAFGRLDCVIANHGVWPPHDAPISTMTTAQWRDTVSVNLDSVFGIVPAAERGEAFHADYAAGKGALISPTKSLSSELIGQGIYCNCVAPGWVATEMSVAVLNNPETSKKLLGLIPLGRPAHVDEIAAPILFLCTPFAGFISGEIFNVNGGAVLTG